jgi:YgiT-type zinc finger domain-containing protein
MKCRICGSHLTKTTTDLPFKVSERTIVIVKGLPLFQCERCSEYLFDDPTFARVEDILARADVSAEVEIIRFAA